MILLQADKYEVISDVEALIKDEKKAAILPEVLYVLFFIYTSKCTESYIVFSIDFIRAMLFFIRQSDTSAQEKVQLFYNLQAFVASIVPDTKGIFKKITTLHKPLALATTKGFTTKFKFHGYVLAFSFYVELSNNKTAAANTICQLAHEILTSPTAPYCPNSPYFYTPNMGKVMLGCVIHLMKEAKKTQNNHDSSFFVASDFIADCRITLEKLNIKLNFSDPDALKEYTTAYEDYLAEKEQKTSLNADEAGTTAPTLNQ